MSNMSNMKILFLDIETSPNKVYAWGLWDQNIAINQIVEAGKTLCWAAKWHGDKKLLFNSLVKQSSKHQMIKEVHNLLNEADVVIHYNGKKFDIPVLNKEFILAGLVPPSNYKEIDLLGVVRHRFRFPSNKLAYVTQVLGIGFKLENKGMELWKGCMENDQKSWVIMEKYNKQDVTLLEKLYAKILPWIKQHPNHGLYVDETRPVCRNCASRDVVKNGIEIIQAGKYQRYRCNDCGAPQRGSTLLNSVHERRRLLK